MYATTLTKKQIATLKTTRKDLINILKRTKIIDIPNKHHLMGSLGEVEAILLIPNYRPALDPHQTGWDGVINDNGWNLRVSVKSSIQAASNAHNKFDLLFIINYENINNPEYYMLTNNEYEAMKNAVGKGISWDNAFKLFPISNKLTLNKI